MREGHFIYTLMSISIREGLFILGMENVDKESIFSYFLTLSNVLIYATVFRSISLLWIVGCFSRMNRYIFKIIYFAYIFSYPMVSTASMLIWFFMRPRSLRFLYILILSFFLDELFVMKSVDCDTLQYCAILFMILKIF